MRVSELSVASARDRWLEAAVVSGQGELDNSSLRCVEQESEVCMYTEGIDQIQGRIEVMKENELNFRLGRESLRLHLLHSALKKLCFVAHRMQRIRHCVWYRCGACPFSWKHRAECAAISESEYGMRAITILSLLHSVFHICDFIYFRMESKCSCVVSCHPCHGDRLSKLVLMLNLHRS